jgi:hypothetical protein
MGERERQGESGGFKVVDRRRFHEDGTPVDERDAPAPRPEPAASPAGSEPPPRAAQASRRAEASRPVEPTRPDPVPQTGAGPMPPATFSALVQMLAMSALDALGAVPGPDGSAPPPDPALARHSIDLLGVLQEKTRNNLATEEARLLEQTLFDLRMLAVRSGRARA